jgi:hypothetical protein
MRRREERNKVDSAHLKSLSYQVVVHRQRPFWPIQASRKSASEGNGMAPPPIPMALSEASRLRTVITPCLAVGTGSV